MSEGERSLSRHRGRMLLAGAGSTAALVGAVVLVALVGAGLVAFDAWPRPAADATAALPLAPARTPAPAGAADGPSDPATPATPASATGGPGAAADGRAAGDAPGTTTTADERIAPDLSAAPEPAPADPDAGAPATPLATPAPPALVPLGAAGAVLADATRDAGLGVGQVLEAVPGTSGIAVTDGAADAVGKAAEAVAQALERLPG